MYARDVPPSTVFYHGTKADLGVGDLLGPGFGSNFAKAALRHVYFSATLEAATSVSTSSLVCPVGVRDAPAATGFMPMAERPLSRQAWSSAAAISVLPISVSVPVTKQPRAIAG